MSRKIINDEREFADDMEIGCLTDTKESQASTICKLLENCRSASIHDFKEFGDQDDE